MTLYHSLVGTPVWTGGTKEVSDGSHPDPGRHGRCSCHRVRGEHTAFIERDTETFYFVYPKTPISRVRLEEYAYRSSSFAGIYLEKSRNIYDFRFSCQVVLFIAECFTPHLHVIQCDSKTSCNRVGSLFPSTGLTVDVVPPLSERF